MNTSASGSRSKLSHITQKLKAQIGPVLAQARTDEKQQAYANWLADFRASSAQCTPVPESSRLHLSVLLCCPPSTNAALLERTQQSLAAQTRPADWVEITHDAPTRWWQQAPAPGWTLLLHAGDTLEPQALFMLERTLVDHATPDSVLLYCDHDDHSEPEGQPQHPRLKPALNLDLLRSLPYMGRALVLQNAWGQRQLGAQQGLPDLAEIGRASCRERV